MNLSAKVQQDNSNVTIDQLIGHIDANRPLLEEDDDQEDDPESVRPMIEIDQEIEFIPQPAQSLTQSITSVLDQPSILDANSEPTTGSGIDMFASMTSSTHSVILAQTMSHDFDVISSTDSEENRKLDEEVEMSLTKQVLMDQMNRKDLFGSVPFTDKELVDKSIEQQNKIALQKTLSLERSAVSVSGPNTAGEQPTGSANKTDLFGAVPFNSSAEKLPAAMPIKLDPPPVQLVKHAAQTSGPVSGSKAGSITVSNISSKLIPSVATSQPLPPASGSVQLASTTVPVGATKEKEKPIPQPKSPIPSLKSVGKIKTKTARKYEVDESDEEVDGLLEPQEEEIVLKSAKKTKKDAKKEKTDKKSKESKEDKKERKNREKLEKVKEKELKKKNKKSAAAAKGSNNDDEKLSLGGGFKTGEKPEKDATAAAHGGDAEELVLQKDSKTKLKLRSEPLREVLKVVNSQKKSKSSKKITATTGIKVKEGSEEAVERAEKTTSGSGSDLGADKAPKIKLSTEFKSLSSSTPLKNGNCAAVADDGEDDGEDLLKRSSGKKAEKESKKESKKKESKKVEKEKKKESKKEGKGGIVKHQAFANMSFEDETTATTTTPSSTMTTTPSAAALNSTQTLSDHLRESSSSSIHGHLLAAVPKALTSTITSAMVTAPSATPAVSSSTSFAINNSLSMAAAGVTDKNLHVTSSSLNTTTTNSNVTITRC